MSVRINQLTKIYGTQKAVDDISFHAEKGAITGFLGPNGAGKSTTMKMVTGFIQPTSGSVSVNDVDVLESPLRVKQITGYLPEHNPLYLEMYVREFLRFIARAYGLKHRSRRVEEMIKLCGLERESSKKISALSKGYRQRVGLAQALIHDPPVLILDEPTSGLDPNQIIEIRDVIKQISVEKTIILSTHIMQEVEALCDQVVIIDKGSIVANDTIEKIKQGATDSKGIILEFEHSIDIELFRKGGFDIKSYGENTYLIESEEDSLRADLLKFTSDMDLPLVSLKKAQKTLEEIFQGLTGSEKR